MCRVGRNNSITSECQLISLATVLEVLKESFGFGYNIAGEGTDTSLEKIINYF